VAWVPRCAVLLFVRRGVLRAVHPAALPLSVDAARKLDGEFGRSTAAGSVRSVPPRGPPGVVGVQGSVAAAGDRGVIRIVLARHGRPAWDFRTPIAGHGLAEWLRGEAAAPLARLGAAARAGRGAAHRSMFSRGRVAEWVSVRAAPASADVGRDRALG